MNNINNNKIKRSSIICIAFFSEWILWFIIAINSSLRWRGLCTIISLFFGFIGLYLLILIWFFPQKITDEYEKIKHGLLFWNNFFVVIFLTNATFVISILASFSEGAPWNIELIKHLPLLSAGMIGGIWGYGLSELREEYKSIKNKSKEDFLSDSSIKNLQKIKIYAIANFVVFNIILFSVKIFNI